MSFMTSSYQDWSTDMLRGEITFISNAAKHVPAESDKRALNTEVEHMTAEMNRREGKPLFYGYVAKNFSMAADLRMAARYLATVGYRVTIKGGKTKIDATPAVMAAAIKAGYSKFGF